jgi:GntR family transcriptional regulator/MocR family aminotransferase
VTVILAYDHLLNDGYLVARERSGYFVNPDVLQGQVHVNASKGPNIATGLPESLPNWSKRLVKKPSEQKNINKPLDWKKYDYPFIYGQLDSN